MSDPGQLDPGRIDPARGLTIRPMIDADIEPVMAIAAAVPTAPHWPRSGYEVALQSFASPSPGSPRRIALAAWHSGRLVGFAIASLVPPEAELESIAIAADAQGFGFGSALLLAIAGELSLAGADQIALEVRVSNQQAIRFYRGQGLGEVGRRPAYYADPGEDALILRLDLENYFSHLDLPRPEAR